MRIFIVLLFLLSYSSVHAESYGDSKLNRWKSGDWNITIQDYGKSIGKTCYLLGRGINADGLTAQLWLYPTGEKVGSFSKRTELKALSVDVGGANVQMYASQTDDVVAIFRGEYKSLYRVGSQAFYTKLKEQEDFSMFMVKAKDRNGKLVTMTFSSNGLLSARNFLLDKCW